MATKAQLRRQLFANLPADVSAASLTVAKQFAQLDLPHIFHILAYRPLPVEIDPGPLLAQLDSSVSIDYVLPSQDAPLPSGAYDVILVPCLGYTADNFRLGRGGGWYDRLLALQPAAVTVGLACASGQVVFEPETYDIPLAHILTA